jgi:hypothetical protein
MQETGEQITTKRGDARVAFFITPPGPNLHQLQDATSRRCLVSPRTPRMLLSTVLEPTFALRLAIESAADSGPGKSFGAGVR